VGGRKTLVIKRVAKQSIRSDVIQLHMPICEHF